MSKNYSEMSVEELIEAAEIQARNYHDGHLSILKFTTHWKAFFGTPDLRSGMSCTPIARMSGHETLKEALLSLLEGIETIGFED